MTRQIYGAVKEGDVGEKEPMKSYVHDMTVINKIKIWWLRWTGDVVVRMGLQHPVKRLFLYNPYVQGIHKKLLAFCCYVYW